MNIKEEIAKITDENLAGLVKNNKEVREIITQLIKERCFCPRACHATHFGICIGRSSADKRRPGVLVVDNFHTLYNDLNPRAILDIPSDCPFGFKK